MEPLKPDIKKTILEANPDASPEEIEEYQKLLAERFSSDPDRELQPEAQATLIKKKTRLQELYQKLFLSARAH